MVQFVDNKWFCFVKDCDYSVDLSDGIDKIKGHLKYHMEQIDLI